VYSLEQWNEQICSLEGKMRNEVIGAMKAAMSAVVQVSGEQCGQLGGGDQ
jgi:hypothetical protein